MPDSLVTVTNVFRIEDDVVSLLRGQNDEELRPFEGSQETAVTDEQIEHHINISFLLFTKTRAKQHLERRNGSQQSTLTTRISVAASKSLT